MIIPKVVMKQTVRSAEREIKNRKGKTEEDGGGHNLSVASLLVSGVAILVVILKGTGDVTDPPRPVAMTTSGQACHIILCVWWWGGNKARQQELWESDNMSC